MIINNNMVNNSNAFINIGDTNQSNTIIINAKINTSIKRLQKDFREGKFAQALEDLDNLFSENMHNVNVKYQLLIVKISFYFELRRVEEAKEYIELLENDYSKFINELKFKELKLTLMAFEKNKIFFDLSKSLRLETPNSKPQGHFDIVFYLNSGNFEKAKEIFDFEIQNDKYRDKLLIVGGHLNSNLYDYIENNPIYYNEADKYYQEALLKQDISFLDRKQIQGFYTNYFINCKIRQEQVDDLKYLEYVKNYIVSINTIFGNKKYFKKEYIDNLIDNYLFSLLSLKKEKEYIVFYEKNKKDLSIRHYIQYCVMQKNEIEHEYIQDIITTKNVYDDIAVYASLILDKVSIDIKKIIDFFNQHKRHIENNFIRYCYIRGLIILKLDIEEDLYNKIINSKYEDVECLLASIQTQLYRDKKVEKNNIEKLINFCDDKDILGTRVIEVVQLLKRLGRQQEYFQIALNKQDIQKDIIKETLLICRNDNLIFNIFDDFVNGIKQKDDVYGLLGDIYATHEKLDKAFDYYYLQFNNSPEKRYSLALLQIGHMFYQRYNKKIDNKKLREAHSYLIAMLENLETHELIFLVGYGINMSEDIKGVLLKINTYILNTNIKEIQNELKEQLASIYLNTSFSRAYNDIFEKVFIFRENLCLVHDGKTYIRNEYSVIDDNTNNFGFILVSDGEYAIKKRDESHNEESLFHRITATFSYQQDALFIKKITMDESKEEPLSELFNFLDDLTKQRVNIFLKYSKGKEVGLYTLSSNNYENYFSLIPNLLENTNINFFSGYDNYMNNKVKKLLTFSSIIFLEHINQLDDVLKREDIYLQRTFINWITEYIDRLDGVYDFFTLSNDERYSFEIIQEQEHIDKHKDFILRIASKVIGHNKIVEDYKEVFPIKEAYKLLSPHVGKDEYQALAYCLNHNYQIITEDRIFNMLFDVFKFNKAMVSNSLSLLIDIISYEELRELKINLHQKKYRYVLNEDSIKHLVDLMKKLNLSELNNKEKEFFKIMNEYGWLENMKLYPKINLQKKTFFDNNLKYLLDFVK